MTMEEAILRLKNVDIRGAEQEDYDALDMAIEALEQQDNDKSKINFVVKEEEFKRYEKELLEKLKRQPLTVIPKEQHCEDCVSREKVKKIVDFYKTMYDGICRVNEDIDKLPSVKPATVWHRIKTRPLTEEEKDEMCLNGDYYTFMDDCKMPDDEQEVLIKTKLGIEKTTYHTDDGCYFEDYEDEDDVIAWTELPKWEEEICK